MLKRVQHDGAWRVFLALLLLFCAFPAVAQTFPPLTGRVVDAANLLQPDQKAALEAKLQGIEQATGHQVVIATIPDMQGYPLEDYGYQLGRAWQIGDKVKNDGLLIILAPNNPAGQRGPRIEVGYGLEPLVTDAFSGILARTVMTPKLRAGDVYGALDAGVDAIGAQIKLTPEEAAKRTAELASKQKASNDRVNPAAFLFWIVIILFVIVPLVGRMAGRGRRHSSGLGEALLWTAINVAANSGRDHGDWGGGGGGGGGGWGGGGGGGFSGGGGSFGGGGASGDW